MRVLVIIPAYNEAKNITVLIEELKKTCPEYDLVAVNDSSEDNTAELCRRKGIGVLDLPVNLGIGGAVQSGYIYALRNGYDAAVQVDGDGQHDPCYIAALLSQLEMGTDLCIGSRFLKNEGYRSSFSRRLGIRYFSHLIRLVTGLTVTDPTSGFRAAGRRAIGLFASDYPWDYPEPESIVTAARNGLIINEIPVIMIRRKTGRSTVTNIRSIYYMIKVSLAVIIASLCKYCHLKETDI